MALRLEERLRAALRDKLPLQGVRTVPPWDALPPSTRLLLKQREAAEAERALWAQRQAFGQRMERLERRRQELARQEQQLRERVGGCATFLEAAAAGRARALGRARREREQAARQSHEAARLRRELAGLLRRRHRLSRRLRGLRVFGDFLQRVLERAAQFQDAAAVLAHGRALAATREALARQAEAAHERLASRWSHFQATAAHKTLLLGQIRMAVLNLFQLATKQLKVPAAAALEDTEAQLDTVLLCMRDLAAIRAELGPGEAAAASRRPPAPLSRE
ncbi:cilia- and flagella-associated protein 73 [Eudromia elegans]